MMCVPKGDRLHGSGSECVGVCVAELSTTQIPNRTGMHLEIAHYKVRLLDAVILQRLHV
jgi:hypothetical protein